MQKLADTTYPIEHYSSNAGARALSPRARSRSRSS